MPRKAGFFLLVSIFILTLFCAWRLVTPVSVFAQGTDLQNAQQERSVLEAQLAELEKEIADKQQLLASQQGQSSSLKNDIAILTTKITAAKLDIKAKNLVITKLSQQIDQKAQAIEDLSTKLDREQQSLAQLLRKTNQLDDAAFVNVVLSTDSLSEFYSDIDAFSSIKTSIKTSVDKVKGVKSQTEVQKQSLEDAQNKAIDARKQIEAAQAQVLQSQKEKQSLLSISKDKEKAYKAVLADRQAQAGKIRAALFQLAGGSDGIQFGDAYQYALVVKQKTGLDPAFLLSVLTQESNLGLNVGSCYLTDTVTGAGVGVKSGTVIAKVMKPGRDIDPFLQITSDVGRDPFKTLVSCPMSIGWGGAMGPAQFIPSTWQMFKDRVSTALGKASADPWNPQDAFMAAGLYLTDLGADGSSYTSERTAACKYFSGSSCSKLRQAALYGDQVMARAKDIQTNQIDLLQGL